MTQPVYVRRNNAWRTAIIARDASGSAVTGLTDGSFTKQLSKDGVGNQSVSGVTVTEVDATNNPGEYTVVIPAARISSNGHYSLQVFRTADPTYAYEAEFRVTDDGTAASLPVGSFTATASNGRVVSGASPLDGVNLWLTDGTSTIGAVSDASGLWGPVYLSNGTWTVTAQKSGYALATGAITVTAGVATGPGTDLSLTSNTTGATLIAGTLIDYARRMAFDASGDRADEELYAAVNDALVQIATDDDWQWYLRRGFLSLNAAATPTVTITSGSAIATTAGTFPTWAANGRMFFNNQTIDVLSRDSATQVTLDGAWAGATYTGSVVLFQNEYPLPADMLRFGRVLTGQRWGWSPSPTSLQKVYEAEASATYGQILPDAFAIGNNKVVLWPYPNEATTVAYSYQCRPAAIASESDVVDADPNHLELIHRAIDYQVAIHTGKCVAGDAAACFGRYQEARSRAVQAQKRLASVDSAMDPYGQSAPLWRRRNT